MGGEVTKKILAFFLLLLLSPWLTWSSPWAIIVNQLARNIQIFDVGVFPPKMYGPFLSGSLESDLFGVSITPDNHYALISAFYGAKLYKIDISDPTSPLLAGIKSLGYFYPEDISISPNGKFAVVTDGGSESRIAFINLSNLSVSLYRLYTPSAHAQAVAIANDNQTVILCDYYSNRIIYGKVNSILSGLLSENVLSTDSRPVNVAISPDGSTALVACHWSYCVDVFRISADGAISPGNQSRVSGFYNAPQSIAFSADGLRAYILCVGTRDSLSWLRINRPGDVSMGGDRVTNLFSYSQGKAYFGINLLAVSPLNDIALAGPNGDTNTNNRVSLINLFNFQSMTLPWSQYDAMGIATFNTYMPKLTIQSGSGGTTNPPPGFYSYDRGWTVQVTAEPDIYFIFKEWTGDVTGASNPIFVTMTKDCSIKANFRYIYPPIATGRKVLNRTFSQAEYIDILSWRADPANEGLDINKYRIYIMSGETRSLLVELAADQVEYRRRKAGQASILYAITAVTSSGREGAPTLVTVQ